MTDKKKGNGEYENIKDNMNSWTQTGSAKNLKSEVSEEETKTEKEREEQLLKELQDELDKLSSKDIIVQFMMSLSSMAYKKMGLPVGTNDKYKDKEQAKLAIDSFDALLKVINDNISAQEKDNLQSSLTNLQMNFVKAFGI
ncbi:MAG: DUF1844 domain-containing protein [Actinomycetota bacterium]|nr:DUF1844 domain-containing protein [Actinomycetota bacterium]